MLEVKAATFLEPVMQRSHGAACVEFAGTRLCKLQQRGSAKAILPRVTTGPEVVFLNTSGGLTAGDTLEYACDLRDGARVVATTQAAERAYRADEGRASVQVRHRVGAGCWLDWLPQETILFERAKLARETVIELAPDAGCLMLEAVILGRIAMGERLTDLQFLDIRRIERAGKPIFIEPFLLDSDILAQGPRSAILGESRAMATLVLCDQGAQDAADTVRAILDEPGVAGAVSG